MSDKDKRIEQLEEALKVCREVRDDWHNQTDDLLVKVQELEMYQGGFMEVRAENASQRATIDALAKENKSLLERIAELEMRLSLKGEVNANLEADNRAFYKRIEELEKDRDSYHEIEIDEEGQPTNLHIITRKQIKRALAYTKCFIGPARNNLFKLLEILGIEVSDE